MANFIELTSNKSNRPILVNTDSIAWLSAKEVKSDQLVTVIYFSAAYPADVVSITVKEDYGSVIKKIIS